MNFHSVVLLILLITSLCQDFACSRLRRCLEDLDDGSSKMTLGVEKWTWGTFGTGDSIQSILARYSTPALETRVAPQGCQASRPSMFLERFEVLFRIRAISTV